MKNENYYVTHGWMINELGLSGVELDVYAIIYGFSQDGHSEFTGSIKYLMEWTGKTNKTVISALSSLVERGLIIKREINIAEHLKLVAYKAADVGSVKITQPMENFTDGQCKNYTGGSVKITHNNKTNNTNNIYINIVDYLNQKAGTNYRATTPKTQSLIKARLAEGFTLDDFKRVIDNKVAEWKGTEMQQYLRPETLFGTKFEGYLNAKAAPAKSKNKFNNFDQRSYDMDDIERRMLGV